MNELLFPKFLNAIQKLHQEDKFMSHSYDNENKYDY